MIRRGFILLGALLCVATMALPGGASAAGGNCETEPRPACFGIESVEASLSTSQAGAWKNTSSGRLAPCFGGR